MRKVHIYWKELQAVALVLLRIAFCLACMVVGLHLDKSIAKAYLYNQGGTVSTILTGWPMGY